MGNRYELNETDVAQIEQAAMYALMFEEQGLGPDDLYIRDASGIARLFHNIVVIYGLDKANKLLDVIKGALDDIHGFEELHEAYLLAVDVKRGLKEGLSDNG